ncbi:ABC transporter permease [Streptomyces sp. CNQ085]|uniref:ABC transporter permease n=1 Tax=Streptomyces sp. CNQ085 TaxID=2886944 RepID=UPI001F508BEF|nr:ABC transporter permease [Streptomyces sp. CNQ085]MCI0383107.1 ABC transporter permease [Streptomyces sp. CNQ085]
MIGLGLTLGFRITGGFGGFLAGALLLVVFAAAVSWCAVLIGMLAGDAEKVQAFGFTLIFPITFTSSAFVIVDTMPGWPQAWADVNPVTHLSDAYRGLLLGGEVAPAAAVVAGLGGGDSGGLLPAGDGCLSGQGLRRRAPPLSGAGQRGSGAWAWRTTRPRA